MKGKHIFHILYEYQLNIYLTVDSVDCAIFAKLISFKIIETQCNRVFIFFHEIFRINVELNFDLQFWS